MIFTGSREPLIYMIFTGYRQPPFFDLHDIYRISTAPFFNLHGIYRVSTAPFFNLRGIYRISTAPFFQFMWYLQCYLQDIDSPPFLIYVVFTGSRQPPFSIYMVFTMSFTGSWQPPSYKFTCYLHDLCSFALQHLQYLSLYLHVSMPKFT